MFLFNKDELTKFTKIYNNLKSVMNLKLCLEDIQKLIA